MNILNLREPFSAWSHGTWLLLSFPATWLLWRKSGADLAKRLSVLIFGMSLAFCYAGSMLYHGLQLPRSGLERLDELDHIGIFFLIAGSYTPVVWNLMRGWWRRGTLALVWFVTLVGSIRILTIGVLPIFGSTLFYLVIGWGALVCYFELTRLHAHRTLFPLLLGGVLYSVGAFLNLLAWPVLWPGVFGPHEVFHLFVMAGSLSHFWFVLKVVVPCAGAVHLAREQVSEATESGNAVFEDEPTGKPSALTGCLPTACLRASPRSE
jgi:hemolysin III